MQTKSKQYGERIRPGGGGGGGGGGSQYNNVVLPI